MNTAPTILAYLGPESIIPLTSILAAIGGVMMMGWRFFFLQIKRILRLPTREPESQDNQTHPGTASGNESP